MIEFLGMDDLIDWEDAFKLIARAVLDLGFVYLLVHVIYRRTSKTQEFIFSFYLLNFITFVICVLLRKVPVDLGFALGLFAVFGILRYRTKPIPIKELTYLFIVIGIAILNAMVNRRVSLAELLVSNITIVLLAAALTLPRSVQPEQRTSLRYDNIALLIPEKRQELIEELQERTGLSIRDVEVERIDLLRDSADLVLIHKHQHERKA